MATGPDVKLAPGVIARLNRGFGFLTPDDGSQECFFHFRAVHNGRRFDDLVVGDRVVFDATYTERGRRATHVVVVPS